MLIFSKGFSQDLRGADISISYNLSTNNYETTFNLYTSKSDSVYRPYIIYNSCIIDDSLYFFNQMLLSNNILKKTYTGKFACAGSSNLYAIVRDSFRVANISNIISSETTALEIKAFVGIASSAFTGPNANPIIQSDQDQVIYNNGIYTFQPNAIDSDNDSLSFSLTQCNACQNSGFGNVTINPITGEITFVPTAVGSYSIAYQIKEFRTFNTLAFLMAYTTHEILFDVPQISSIQKITNNEFNIYPNPSNGIFNIQFQDSYSENVIVSVYNSIGEEIKNYKIANSKTFQLDLSNQSKGMYYIKMQNNKFSKSEKILIE